jgi:hypothetical protein
MPNPLLPRVSFPQEKLIDRSCPACGAHTLRMFYAVQGVPVQSNRQLRIAADAEAIPTGDIILAQCETCAFITNIAFDESLLPLGRAEATGPAMTPEFCDFAKQQADDWIDRFDLCGKTLIEIGCGQGEFLEMLCERAGARGIGFDPAVRREGNPAADVIFVAGPFEAFAGQANGDFIFCRQTLQTLAEPLKFLSLLQPVVAHAPVVFEVPDAARALAEGAYWDIDYTQCSYFSAASLTRVFQRSGFEVIRTTSSFGDRFVTVEATTEPFGGQKRDMPTLTELRGVTNFVRLATRRLSTT